MRFVFFAGLAFVINASFSAIADDTPSPSVFDMLRASAALAADNADARFAYTVDFWGRENDEERALKVRYDPRLPVGARWRLVEGSLEALDKETRKELENLEDIERPDEKLIYDKVSDMLADMELVEEADAYAVFRGPLKNDEGLPEDVLQATITLNKATGHIERIEARALEPFKPAPIAKIRQFYQDQRYAPPLSDGPPLLMESASEVTGKAMFRKFSVQDRRRFSDIERVNPEDIATAE